MIKEEYEDFEILIGDIKKLKDEIKKSNNND